MRSNILPHVAIGIGLSCIPAVPSVISAGGSINANTTWNADTVLVADSVIVSNGVRLDVAPGTLVLAAGACQISIAGRIVAAGRGDDSIVFAAHDTATGWLGFTFNSPAASNDSSLFSYCVISNAKKTGSGGGIYAANAKLRLSHTALRNNWAVDGGGMYCSGTGVLIDHCVFANNTASGKGGGLLKYHANMAVTTSTVFRGNGALDGGGAYIDGWRGGFSNCRFERNTAKNYGGGVYLKDSQTPLINCGIVDNSATQRGGGIYDCDQFSDAHYCINCLIHGNSAGESGGGAYLYDYGLGMTNHFCNCTISGNSAPTGGGILSYAVSLYLTNDIIWGNTAAARGPQLGIGGTYGYDNTNLYFKNVTVQGGTQAFSGRALNETNYIAVSLADPLFSDTALNDFTLRTGSPCIDSGLADTAGLDLPALDLTGLPRIVNTRVDRGAYEYQKPVAADRRQTIRSGVPEARHAAVCDLLGRKNPPSTRPKALTLIYVEEKAKTVIPAFGHPSYPVH